MWGWRGIFEASNCNREDIRGSEGVRMMCFARRFADFSRVARDVSRTFCVICARHHVRFANVARVFRGQCTL